MVVPTIEEVSVIGLGVYPSTATQANERDEVRPQGWQSMRVLASVVIFRSRIYFFLLINNQYKCNNMVNQARSLDL
jgi:hypothetical protein